jgi:hypothetical protein
MLFGGALFARAGLLRRFAPRNDAEALREKLSYSIVKQPPASLAATPGTAITCVFHVQTHAIAPIVCPASGSRSSVRPFPPMGRAERLGEEPRPRRPHCCGQPACRRHTSGGPTQRRRSLSRTGPREAGLRLRSAREWTFRLAACPQELSLLPTRAWFVRTAARTCTWTVRPTRRRQSP